MSIADFIAFLAPGIYRSSEKHLDGKHDQARHAWRYGSMDAARRTLLGIGDDAEREEYRRRAGMESESGGGKTPVAKIRSYALNSNVVDYYRKNYQYAIEAEWEGANLAGDPLSFARRAYNVHDSGTGMRMQVTDISYDRWENTMDVEGQILDMHGGYAGHFERSLHFNDLRVHNSLMTIREDCRRGGFATRIYQHAENQYMRAGFQMIDMVAGLDNGGYAWARMGFDFSNKKERDDMRVELEDTWFRRYGSEMPSRIRRALRHAWDFAAVVGPDKALLGKYVMMGSSWSAVKYLDKSDLGYRVGRSYYYARRRR